MRDSATVCCPIHDGNRAASRNGGHDFSHGITLVGSGRCGVGISGSSVGVGHGGIIVGVGHSGSNDNSRGYGSGDRPAAAVVTTCTV
jgi:hypothetical protein